MKKGMNTQAVSGWGSKVRDAQKEQIASQIRTICNQANSLEWTGPDYETFKSTKVSAVETAVKNLETALFELGDSAVRNANAQDTTSSQN